MRYLATWAALAGMIALGGCASRPVAVQPAVVNTNSPGGELIVHPERRVSGRIASVNPGLRFVVVTFPVGGMPGANEVLQVYREGLKVAQIRISGPRDDDSIVADIINGEAEPGDLVRRD